MSTDHARDTLEALWQVVHPDHIRTQGIDGVTLTLDYLRDPQTRQIASVVSLELSSPGLHRVYNWKSPSDMFREITPEQTEETWNGLVLGLAATVTGIILPGKE